MEEQHPKAYLATISIPGKISFGILAQLCSDDSIQIILYSTRFITLRTESNLEGFVWSHQSKTGLVSRDNLPHNASFWQVGQTNPIISKMYFFMTTSL